MSAVTETPVVNEPNVTSSGGYVDAAENFTKSHSGPEGATTAVPAAVTSTPPVASTDATTTGATTEEPVGKKETEITAAPITSGVLGYKAPGPLAFRFKKHLVWLGDEAVSTEELHNYLHGEKPETAHPIAAHASQTGKGLLFIAKDEQSKKTPMSVLHLGDAIHMAKEGVDKISFRLESDKKHKHTFQAGTQDERNGWLVAIETASEHAKSSRKEVEGSEGYQSTLNDLKNDKPVAAIVAGGAATAGAAGTAAAVTHHNKAEKVESVEAAEPAEPVAAARRSSSDDGKKSKSKSRSQSRNKRTSIFDTLRGKKEERDEKKEIKKEEKAEEKEIKKEEKAEDKEIKKEEKAIAAEHKKEDKAVEKEIKKEEKSEEKAIKHEEKAAEKADKEAKKEDAAAESKHKHETEAGIAGGAAVAAGGAAAAATSDKKHKDTTQSTGMTDSSKPAARSRDVSEHGKSKRRSGIFGMFDKVKSPSSDKKVEDKKSHEALPTAAGGKDSKDVFAEDPVSAKRSGAAVAPETSSVPETTAVPASAASTTAARSAAGETSAAPVAATSGTEPTTMAKTTEITSVAEPTTTTPMSKTTAEAEQATDAKPTSSPAEKAADKDAKANKRQSWFGRLGSMRSKSPRDSKKHERKPSTTSSTATGSPAKAAVVDDSATGAAVNAPTTNGTTGATDSATPSTNGLSNGLTTGNTSATTEATKLEPGHHLATTQRLMGIDGKDEAKPLESVIANGTPIQTNSNAGVIGDVVPEAITRGEHIAPASKEIAA